MQHESSSNNSKIVVLLSGNGSNLQAIIDAIATHQWSITITGVISNNADAYGVQRAQQANIAVTVITKTDYPVRADYDAALQKTIQHYQADLVVLAGFMRILSADFVNHFYGRLINIHPSLLPTYKGLNTHQRVLDAGDKIHGVSVHFVTATLDGGPIIAQMQLDVVDGDNADRLQQRIHQLEHRLYPTIIYWFAQKRLLFSANGVQFDHKVITSKGLQLTQDQLAC